MTAPVDRIAQLCGLADSTHDEGGVNEHAVAALCLAAKDAAVDIAAQAAELARLRDGVERLRAIVDAVDPIEHDRDGFDSIECPYCRATDDNYNSVTEMMHHDGCMLAAVNEIIDSMEVPNV